MKRCVSPYLRSIMKPKGDKKNVGPAKNDAETWKIVLSLLKTLYKEDELGFNIGKTHYVIRKGNFSK